MTTEKNSAVGWILGAVAVLTAVAVYLWLTAPAHSLLSETYTVM
jgi:hypothetical protein